MNTHISLTKIERLPGSPMMASVPAYDFVSDCWPLLVCGINLFRFLTLATQSSVIKTVCRLTKIGVGKERLH